MGYHRNAIHSTVDEPMLAQHIYLNQKSVSSPTEIKILVALDGSKASDKVLAKAISLAQKYRASLTLIYVVHTELKGWFIPPYFEKEFEEETLKMGRNLLSKYECTVNPHKVPVKAILAEGYPAEEIVLAAKKGKFDMIVLGHRGRSPTTMLLLGSVAQKVVQHSSCSTLVVR